MRKRKRKAHVYLSAATKKSIRAAYYEGQRAEDLAVEHNVSSRTIINIVGAKT